MRFFFDESGSFRLPNDSSDYRTSVVAALAVADHVIEELEAAFAGFVASLEPHELLHGEPKGVLLCSAHKLAFAALLGRFAASVSFTPLTLYLSDILTPEWQNIVSELQSIARGAADAAPAGEGKQRLDLHARQIGNLSREQALRLYALANAFREAITYSAQYLSTGANESSWENVSFHVDRVHQRRSSREEQVFTTIIPVWLTGWSTIRPIRLARDRHTPSLTMVRKFVTPAGFNLRALLEGNIFWEDSRAVAGLQMADIAAAIVSSVLSDVTDSAALTAYVKLMRTSFYEVWRGPGLMVADNSRAHVQVRFGPLIDAMRRAV